MGIRDSLSADLNLLDSEYATSTAWALQLWALDMPFVGGELSGVKVADCLLYTSRCV